MRVLGRQEMPQLIWIFIQRYPSTKRYHMPRYKVLAHTRKKCYESSYFSYYDYFPRTSLPSRAMQALRNTQAAVAKEQLRQDELEAFEREMQKFGKDLQEMNKLFEPDLPEMSLA